MSIRYLFIVGLPKTGTKLIQNILYNSKSTKFITIGETAFFGHLIRPGVKDVIKKFGDFKNDSTIEKAVNFFFSRELKSSYWEKLRRGFYGIDKEMLVNRLIATDRSMKDIFNVLMTIENSNLNNLLIGDKTPSHLYHVPKILDWYPTAKIIHTFRDPRAIFTSELRKRTLKTKADYLLVKDKNPIYPLMIFLHIVFSWIYAANLHKKYQERYKDNYYLSKFEDLILDPEFCIKKICHFLKIDFEDEMMIPRKSGSSYKHNGKIGFDKRSIDRWEDFLKPEINRFITFILKRKLIQFGYIV